MNKKTVIFVLALSGCMTPLATAPPRLAEQAQTVRVHEAMTSPSSSARIPASDPTTTDPDKYKAIMENTRVRVLRYHDEPHAKTHQHHHPDSILYALSAFRRRLSFPDGTAKERDFHPGDIMWIPAQTHIGENIGTTATEVLLIEMKGD